LAHYTVVKCFEELLHFITYRRKLLIFFLEKLQRLHVKTAFCIHCHENSGRSFHAAKLLMTRDHHMGTHQHKLLFSDWLISKPHVWSFSWTVHIKTINRYQSL